MNWTTEMLYWTEHCSMLKSTLMVVGGGGRGELYWGGGGGGGGVVKQWTELLKSCTYAEVHTHGSLLPCLHAWRCSWL